jgi:hypothetical protein
MDVDFALSLSLLLVARMWNRFTTHFMKIVCCLMETRSLCALRDDKGVFRDFFFIHTYMCVCAIRMEFILGSYFLLLSHFPMHILCSVALRAIMDWANGSMWGVRGFEQTLMIRKVDIWIRYEWRKREGERACEVLHRKALRGNWKSSSIFMFQFTLASCCSCKLYSIHFFFDFLLINDDFRYKVWSMFIGKNECMCVWVEK